MKPSSNREYRLIRDSQGASRRLYKRVCEDCDREDWVRTKQINSTLCRSCTTRRQATPERNAKISATLRSHYTSPSYREMVAAAQKPSSGEDHWNWKGGVTPVNQEQRNSEEASAWRRAVYERDMYHCRICKQNGELHAHHIKPWAAFPESRFDISNGITLCTQCHTNIHTYLREVEKVINGNQAVIG